MSNQLHSYDHCGFDAMGTRINFWIDRSAGHRAGLAFRTGKALINDFDRRLSRFQPSSELCALNDAPGPVAVSPLMLRFVAAALNAAESTGGIVDPTLIDAIERAGYRESRFKVAPASLEEALHSAPAAQPAAADPAARWRGVEIDDDAMTVTLPAGVRLDSGGVGKGLAADMVAQLWLQLLPEGTPFIVDCGGDMRFGELPEDAPAYSINVEPVLGKAPAPLVLRGGGVATSGIGKRIWIGEDGFAHHLIDPATGRPAWTGLISVTALGDTALGAETIAKHALLSGDPAAAELLAEHGGFTVDQLGETTLINLEKTEVFA